MKNSTERAWWWRAGRSFAMRCFMLVLAVVALLPGKAAAAAVAPDDDGIDDRINRIRRQVKRVDSDQRFDIAQRLGSFDAEDQYTLWHNHWDNHWNRWSRWLNWNNHWGNHWNNHWHNH